MNQPQNLIKLEQSHLILQKFYTEIVKKILDFFA